MSKTDQPFDHEQSVEDYVLADIVENNFDYRNSVDHPSQWLYRFPMILIGVILIGLLVTARTLTPANEGNGTHQQLGLPECGFITMFGVPCPSCGMTTSWSHLTRGQVPSSFQANPGGMVLGIASMMAGPWLLLCGVFGRWLPRPIDLRIVLGVVLVIFTITFANWLMTIFG
jgi:hypothetical protein